MILSARAESIILSAPPAESMILSAPPERRWATPAVQWAAGHEVTALGDGAAVARWMVQCHWDEVFFCTSDLCFFSPDFRYLMVFPS
jgi:hypothetical protein